CIIKGWGRKRRTRRGVLRRGRCSPHHLEQTLEHLVTRVIRNSCSRILDHTTRASDKKSWGSSSNRRAPGSRYLMSCCCSGCALIAGYQSPDNQEDQRPTNCEQPGGQ